MKNYSSSCGSERTEDQATTKFRKSLKGFLTFNFVIFILMITGMGGAGLWKISVIWGAILAIKGRHYLKTEDHPREDYTGPSREQYGRPRRPEWRDKDLV